MEIGEGLKRVNTVVFLGAGASQFAGYHTFRLFGELITDPLVRYQEKLPEQAVETPRLIASIHQALIAMKRPTTHDNYLWLLTDYHNFCQKFDTHTGLQDRFQRIKDEIHAFDSATITVINDLTQTTFCHYSRKRDCGLAGDEARLLYEDLALLNNRTEPFLPVFTTNYDLLIEDLFKEGKNPIARMPLSNGIPGLTRKGGRWSPKYYEDIGIHLYRLHGCVGWFNESDDQLNTPVVFNRPERLDGDMLNRLCVMFPGRELQIGKEPHGFSFRLLYSHLLYCRNVLFIGFSFRDDDVMQILLAANAAREIPVRILVVDPRADSEQVLKSLKGAALRSPFHALLPHYDNIDCFQIEFGTNGCRENILKFLTSKH
jgi:hypothetical protein